MNPSTDNSSKEKEPIPGVWIGIDLGTSNCACAVYDSNRGGAKWMRCRSIAAQINGKLGRTVPSSVWIASGDSDGDEIGDGEETGGCYDVSSILPPPGNRKRAFVGQAAHEHHERLLQQANKERSMPPLIRSVKRVLGKRECELDAALVQSLPFAIRSQDDLEDVQIQVGDQCYMPAQLLAIQLTAIRQEADYYLRRNAAKKHLSVPASDDELEVLNAVIGIPAQFNHHQRKLIETAAKTAGFQTVHTMVESSAAAMAYGLAYSSTATGMGTLSKQVAASMQADSRNGGGNGNASDAISHQTILVMDVGGGTTDVTIAQRASNMSTTTTMDDGESNSDYRVVVTTGDSHLGGDDMDEAMAQFCIAKIDAIQSRSDLSHQQHETLMQACRKAKEALCGDNNAPPSKSETIRVLDQHDVEITQDDLSAILKPWLDKARKVVRQALDQMPSATTANEENAKRISEVVLVGGSTRVPAIRHMMQHLFPDIELCISLNPMGSVAQGLAIQAAFLSNAVPKHELLSALMLDCIPHAIGVETANGNFIEVLPKNTPLPAQGSASFVLASAGQPGVTVAAVERIGEDDTTGDPVLESMGEFTFLLHRLDAQHKHPRSVQIGMTVNVDGKFIVSIFDEMDPEHVRKRERRLQDDSHLNNELGYIADLIQAESGVTSEQIYLLVATFGLFVFYVAIKILFADEFREEDSSRIL